MIDQLTIDKVMDAAQGEIVEVVSEFVNLKKRGINYIGHCPFHNEKTPSFTVSPHKGIFKCFGCSKGGNAVHFLMEHEQITFVEAIKQLGKKFNIPVEDQEVSPEMMQMKNERESMMVVTSFAQKFFENSLFETEEGQSVGLSYFRSRGFRDDIIRKFSLGYSPEKKDAFTEEALKNSFKIEYLEKTGLTVVREDYKADRFRGRVMFPIQNLSGKTIAFGGRILKSDAKTAKYLNSPESEIYHKSRILYGIYHARQEMVREDRCYLVEGYTDVISMHQAGITNVVASSGTALTQDQIRLIARFTPNITVLYDGDPAGIKASLRGIDLILEEGMNVKVLLLPDGEDPDSFSRKMKAEDLKKYIADHETDFIKFKTNLLLEDAKNDPIKRATLIQDIVRTISTIPDPITRSIYVKECSVLMNVGEDILYSELGKINHKKLEQNARRRYANVQEQTTNRISSIPDSFTSDNPFELEEREVLRYLIRYGNYPLSVENKEGENISVGEFIVNEMRQDNLQSVNPVYNKVLDLFDEAHQKGHITESGEKFFINHQDVDVSKLASDLISQPYQLSKIHLKRGPVKSEEDELIELVPKVVLELKSKKVHSLIDENQRNIKEAQESGNEELVLELMKKRKEWDDIKKELANLLGNRIIVK